ncbi:MAG: S-layer homology domain-containing protein [Oscillospiraceae bacterium]|nr:S-layer homology domain-containing protein [Oscillospiraceae bacterium]
MRNKKTCYKSIAIILATTILLSTIPASASAQNEPVDNYDPVTGWFILYNPNGNLLTKLNSLLLNNFGSSAISDSNNSHARPYGYTYEEVKKLKIIGTMTEDDFGSAANGMRYASNGIVPCISRMGSLIELDLSRAVIPDNTIPDFAFTAFISLEIIRLPVGIIIPSSNVFKACSSLKTLVCGDFPIVDDALDLSNSGNVIISLATQIEEEVTSGFDINFGSHTGLHNITSIIFPDIPIGITIGDGINPANIENGFGFVKELIFLGNVNAISAGSSSGSGAFNEMVSLEKVVFFQEEAPYIGGNSFSTISETIFTAVAYVPDPKMGGYELDEFTSRFSQVLPLSEYYTPANKNKLQSLLAEAILLDESKFTQESWAELADQLRNAVVYFDHKLSTQAQIDDVVFTLQSAMNLLEHIPIAPNSDKPDRESTEYEDDYYDYYEYLDDWDTPLSSAWRNPFIDVGNDAWYFDFIKYVHMNRLMTGVSSNRFAPSSYLTTAMLVTILARHAGIDTYSGSTWYERGIAWGIDNEITDGTNMVGNVTRQRFVTILYRYAAMLDCDVSVKVDLSKYNDVDDIASWAFDAMSWAVAVGLVNGRTDATIAPLGYATRAETATLLQRFAVLVETQ